MEANLERDLLAIKAVQINPENYFTWTSGIKSPIYCDNRLTMSYPEIRNKITQSFIQLINSMDEKPDVIAGCATAGIPHAAWLSEKMNLPMIYIRSKPKGHGKGNQIEGHYHRGQKVIVIEDLISTGGSAIVSANVLIDEGLHVIGVYSIFTYGLEIANQNFKKENLSYQSLANYDQLLNVLLKDNQIDHTTKEKLTQWRDQL
ncbi:orotate phosphoribosyltransferase [Ornithinibacillus halophilus]|uniref:Orotate phosphoribosyltransferase n=1 Tax=Ornithinibacillus halophilus TaxID=930117 RepID=A0A1M5C5S1_9BACI|nr:orotate phosphoribosyltransferase [Ornithinibacillus halophilus]SHF50114.1 orotate phosphoribosyltransferase [Ornithinibacillus halophilus]